MQAHVKANGQTGSGFVEGLLRGFFEMPERDQKEVIAPIPRYERKAAVNGSRDTPPKAPARPARVGDALVGGPKAERVMVMTTPELSPESTWVEKGPADRMQVIRDMTEAKAAFAKTEEVEPKKKDGVILGDMASKIFTF